MTRTGHDGSAPGTEAMSRSIAVLLAVVTTGFASRAGGHAAAVRSAAVRSATVRSAASRSATPRLPVVSANDNRTAAGVLRNGVLTLDLDVVKARWYPEAADGPWVDVWTFAEHGHAPSIPGPLVRVPRGTRVRLTVHNTRADSAIGMWGMGITATRDGGPGDTLTVRIGAGETRAFEFVATKAGTYVYGARSNPTPPFAQESEQLSGAIVVDEPGARTDDRILMLNIWGEDQKDSTYNNAITINGRSWPYTERFTFTQGDTVRWRVVNGTMRIHPMHLHGAYFRVDARGSATDDTLYTKAARRMAVTEDMTPRSTMRMTWSPETPGDWLFHCHLAFHVVPEAARLNVKPADMHQTHSTDPMQHMAGLVVGITVKPRGAATVRRGARRLSLSVLPGIATDTAHQAPIGVRVSPSAERSAPKSITPRGDLLLLTRGEPTDVTVHNGLAQPTSIHWHGLELESYSDGVAGISGTAARRAPSIAPGDSFVAHLTLKHAGTFIYHTHLNDLEQITTGLYGPIVVLEPGQRFDPTRDLVLTAGFDVSRANGPVVNGGEADSALAMRVGAPVRIRMINIAPADPVEFEVLRDSTVVQWRPVAKDGLTLPSSQASMQRALKSLWVGETFDVEFAPTEPGRYRLRVRADPKTVIYERALIVRAK